MVGFTIGDIGRSRASFEENPAK
jgi:hypothetical protein